MVPNRELGWGIQPCTLGEVQGCLGWVVVVWGGVGKGEKGGI